MFGVSVTVEKLSIGASGWCFQKMALLSWAHVSAVVRLRFEDAENRREKDHEVVDFGP